MHPYPSEDAALAAVMAQTVDAAWIFADTVSAGPACTRTRAAHGAAVGACGRRAMSRARPAQQPTPDPRRVAQAGDRNGCPAGSTDPYNCDLWRAGARPRPRVSFGWAARCSGLCVGGSSPPPRALLQASARGLRTSTPESPTSRTTVPRPRHLAPASSRRAAGRGALGAPRREHGEWKMAEESLSLCPPQEPRWRWRRRAPASRRSSTCASSASSSPRLPPPPRARAPRARAPCAAASDARARCAVVLGDLQEVQLARRVLPQRLLRRCARSSLLLLLSLLPARRGPIPRSAHAPRHAGGA